MMNVMMNVLFFIGLAFVAYGLFVAWQPLAFIFIGTIVMILVWATHVSQESEKDDS